MLAVVAPPVQITMWTQLVEDVEARFVVSVGEPFLGDGHADTGGDALAERTGRGLDAGNSMVLRMARGLAVVKTGTLP